MLQRERTSAHWVLNEFCETEWEKRHLWAGLSTEGFDKAVLSYRVASLCHLCFLLLLPHDYMRTINVSCRPAPNQLLAYDSHYLHLSRRVSGAKPGLRRQEGLVLVVGVRREENVLLDQFCWLLNRLGLTLSNGSSDVVGSVCVSVCDVRQSGGWRAWQWCVKGCYHSEWGVTSGLKQHLGQR